MARPTPTLSSSLTLRVWLAALCMGLLSLLGLRLWFDQTEGALDATLANERARRFVAQEIVGGIQGLEKNLYQMVVSPDVDSLRWLNRRSQDRMDKLAHDLDVWAHGGTVEQWGALSPGEKEAVVRAATYLPGGDAEERAMEVQDIKPLLSKLGERATRMESRLLRRWQAQKAQDPTDFLEAATEVDAFVRHMPLQFERVNENAHRLVFNATQRLQQLEREAQALRDARQTTEGAVAGLVLVFGALAAWTYLQNSRQANAQLAQVAADMKAAKEAAEQASRAKSEFVSRMSHELRTPLNAILGFAELLGNEALTPAQSGHVHLINVSGKHLLELINAVLEHAKIEAGGLTLEHIDFDLPQLLGDVGAIVGPRAEAKGLSYATEWAHDLPQWIVGDPTRLRQVLINLLANATKFTERGTVKLVVKTEPGPNQAETRLCFSVQDTGIGMNSHALSRLFQPFSQADGSITRKYGGTGLGLVISRELVLAMGGDVGVTSEPGVGTRFVFWLPLRPGQAMPALPHPSAPHTDLASAIGGRVLLVDDNKINQKLASAMLTRLGLAFDVANDGQQAVDRVAHHPYAVVLMDMEMPVMDGVTATLHIRAREAKAAEAGHPTGATPIIALTANAMAEDRQRCEAAGMNGYISKPLNLAALQAELRRVMALAPRAG